MLSFSKGEVIMTYLSETLKKEYKDKTKTQRQKNLKYIREKIAKLSLPKFAKETGITKNDLSMLENGDKTLSLFHILAYKKYLCDNHNINLSIDFIMGFTDIIESQNINFQKQVGLSSDSLEMLMLWNEQRKEDNKLLPALGKDIEVINTLLEYQFALTKKVTPNYESRSVFHFIGQYLTPDRMEREQQDRLRVCNGTVWKDIEIGDTLEKADGAKYIVKKTEAINADSNSGSDTSKVYITSNTSNEHYVVDIDAMFKSYSKDNIFAVLDKIKDYMSKRK